MYKRQLKLQHLPLPKPKALVEGAKLYERFRWKGQNLLISNVGIGIFLWIALSSIQPIGLLMSGYASNNKYSLLGGLRAAAQSISYEIPLALSVLAIVLMTNSLSTIDIVNQQSGAGILSWNIWRQPVGFIVFWICALAECERLPFDLPEAEEELVAGYPVSYTHLTLPTITEV